MKNENNNTNNTMIQEGNEMNALKVMTKDELREVLAGKGITLSNTTFRKTKKTELIDMVADAMKTEETKEEVTEPKPVVPVLPENTTITKDGLSIMFSGSAMKELCECLGTKDLYSVSLKKFQENEKLMSIRKDIVARISWAYNNGYRKFYVDGSQGIGMLLLRTLVDYKLSGKDIHIIIKAPYHNQSMMWEDYCPCTFMGYPAVAHVLKNRYVNKITYFSMDFKQYRTINVNRGMAVDDATKVSFPVGSCLDFSTRPQFPQNIKNFIHDYIISVFSSYAYHELSYFIDEEIVMESSESTTFYQAKLNNAKRMVIDADAIFVYDVGETSGPVYQQESFAATGARKYGKLFDHVDIRTLIA